LFLALTQGRGPPTVIRGFNRKARLSNGKRLSDGKEKSDYEVHDD